MFYKVSGALIRSLFDLLYLEQEPDDERQGISKLFRARIINPMRDIVKKQGTKAASRCYNELWALRVSLDLKATIIECFPV